MSKNRCLTLQEETAFRRFFKTRGDWQAKRDWAWMRVLLTTGMRIREFSTLTAGEAMTAFQGDLRAQATEKGARLRSRVAGGTAPGSPPDRRRRVGAAV